MTSAPVRSSYRLQLRDPASGSGFTFSDAERLLDYLDALGVSHLYLSPILTAAPGSSHGYDVVDPTTVSAALGGPHGLARLAAAARSRGMGLIVDIVPNHLGVDPPQHNAWWSDVLRHGRSSRYARFFDIDWDLGDGQILLPVLGSDDELAEATVDGGLLRLGALALPIAPGSGAGSAAEVHERQHYRLVDWHTGRCGYRRFCSIASLAALRQQDREVFEATHTEVARWFAERLVDGVRVDHLDGLADPVGYLAWLRELTGPDAVIVVEKVLAADEPLQPDLPVAGTTGYEVLPLLGGVFIDPTGEPLLSRLAGASTPAIGDLKSAVLTGPLAGDLQRLHRAVRAATGGDHPRLPEAIAAVLGRIEVYRCDYPVLAAVLPAALAQTQADAPELAGALQLIGAAVGAGGEPAVRLQQLCGAVVGAAVEGALYYRDARLVCLNEVGGDPRRFGVDLTEFHARLAERQRRWPHAMTTSSTHDTKRGEDVRARIGVLSQVPALWAQAVARWESMAPSPDAMTGLFLWQNIFGVWPADGAVTESLRRRLHGYARKAVREAGAHSSWQRPDLGFEAAVAGWLDRVFDGPVAGELTALAGRLDPHARRDALGQKLLALTVPGAPDLYQGSELWEDSLVDPDNRRPVDYPARWAALAQLRHPKLRVVHAALALRRERPVSFAYGDYRPVPAAGGAAAHLIAFGRGEDVLVAVSRWSIRLAETGWGDTVLVTSPGSWCDRLTGRVWPGSIPAADLFATLPVALLERTGR